MKREHLNLKYKTFPLRQENGNTAGIINKHQHQEVESKFDFLMLTGALFFTIMENLSATTSNKNYGKQIVATLWR